MADSKTNRFTPYFPLLLDALRSTDPEPMRPAEVRAWILEHGQVPQPDLTRQIVNGKQTIFENDVHWARFYLAKAGLVDSPQRGRWGLTAEGRSTHLDLESTWELYTRIRDSHRTAAAQPEEVAPAPGLAAESDEDINYWFAGSQWDKNDDQMQRFLAEGIWGIGTDGQFLPLPARMSPGDRIAIKSAFVQRYGLPFELGGKPVAVMRIKATGTVLGTNADGMSLRVAWDPSFQPRDWYFYTYQRSLVAADQEQESARRLIDFTFHGASQDYGWFLSQPYWLNKYGVPAPPQSQATDVTADTERLETPAYTVSDISKEDCFVPQEELARMLSRWRAKKNCVLQGPPGTGKTWLAKRLGFAMIGSKDRETVQSRLRVVQFHPSLAYEDFVRGYRPAGDGRLTLVDGLFLQCIAAAAAEPGLPFVLVIEEINRGHPAQIFGEILTLLEDTKRKPSEAIELSYRHPGERPVYIPDNLYVIGTMNVADRSLAIVDLALRRRFAFFDLVPNFGPLWRSVCEKFGLPVELISRIHSAVEALNEEIASTSSLGPQFRLGHSYFTPDKPLEDGQTWDHWYLAKVETEVFPLLDEYWYDAPETAAKARARLLAGVA